MPSAPKTSRREHSDQKKGEIIALNRIGLSTGSIAQYVDLPKSTVIAILRRWRKTNYTSIVNKKRPGRPPKLSERDEQKLIRFVATNPMETLACYSTPLRSGWKMYISTTRRYLKKNKFYIFKARRKPYLKPSHKKARVDWCKWARILRMKD